MIDDLMRSLDGRQSVPSIDELYRRTLVRMHRGGLGELPIPEKTARAYLSLKMKEVGKTTRSHLTNHLRGASFYTSYPAIRPGQVVAIDVTRADNLVWDPWSEKVISVEIITALDVATRVVLAFRVVPRSATAYEAGLILYDVLRPFSMAVSPEHVGDWRWAGVPESLGMIDDAVAEAERLSGRPLVGEHLIPGVLPDAIRADNGSIFTSTHFRELCQRLGIHLLLSRGKKPTDNAFVERWHETLQRGLMQVYGHKGRNPSQRGSDVGKIAKDKRGRYIFKGDGPLLTVRELERHMREFITVDYHRSWHQGLAVVDGEVSQAEAQLRMTPLEVFDAMVASTGRIHVLQRADLLYDFLPVAWGTIGHAGVEFKNLTYDCAELDEFRNVPKGFFRDGDEAAPFFVDPNDVSRVWFRHPKTDEIIEVPWRQRHLLQAPMTDRILNWAKSSVRRRGGNWALSKSTVQRELVKTLNDLGDLDRLRNDADLSDWKLPMLIASNMRSQRSAFDHAEAAVAAGVLTPQPGSVGLSAVPLPVAEVSAGSAAVAFDPYTDPWPAYLFEDPSC